MLSPVVGYGAEYPLLHFVYDLSLWTTIETKKNIAARSNVALRHLLKGSPWTPEYWRVRHRAVLDMQRQCGHASLFRTRETLHMAHILLQLDKGNHLWRHGSDGSSRPPVDRPHPRPQRSQRQHQDRPGPRDPTGISRRQAQTSQSEISWPWDGPQSLFGFLAECRLHWLGGKACIPEKESQPLLHGIVLDSQQDYKDSKLPVRTEPSAWNPETETVDLQHRQEDKDAHIRAYFPATMEVSKCHEDIQQGTAEGGRRNGAILRYVATYDMKFSSSITTEWLQGEGSDYSAAVGVLRRMRVLEPEMWLTLAQERFPQASLSGSLVDIMIPTLNVIVKPKLVETYEMCTWRSEEMTFLEFLRKSNKDGEVIRYIQEEHKQRVMQEVQALTGQDDKAFAVARREMLGAWNRHEKEQKRDDEEGLSLTGFLAQTYDHVRI